MRALEGCDALYHLAADYRLRAPRLSELYETNIAGTRTLVLAALDAGVGRVVYTSSVAALGLTPDLTPDGRPADGETPRSPWPT